jgi:Ca2+-binding RTX toxin-like protein
VGSTVVVSRNDGSADTSFAMPDYIVISGTAGNDTIEIDPNYHGTAIVDGGAGDDVITGGGGDDILIGGAGNDVIYGRAGRDLIIGGNGSDTLFGFYPGAPQAGRDDDLLIGGRTSYDGDAKTLLKVLTEWGSSKDYDTRVSDLRTGAGGVPVLNSTTVFTDSSATDTLRGQQGMDWFFANLARDVLVDRQIGEDLN